jgi:hypothetical protein
MCHCSWSQLFSNCMLSILSECTVLPTSHQILGRATELNLFVKNGTDAGYIEIELKGKGKANLIVRRHLKSSSRGSSFTLNGQPATGTEIKQKMGELNVQVGNLWCLFRWTHLVVVILKTAFSLQHFFASRSSVRVCSYVSSATSARNPTCCGRRKPYKLA